MTEHGAAQAAILAYLTGQPKPELRLPPSDWGQALSAGSANIPLMFVVAGYGYKVPAARECLLSLGRISRTRFMLAEPLSPVYGAWHFCSWLLALDIANKRGDLEVYEAIRPLIVQYLGLCALMSARCPAGNLSDDETRYKGQRIVTFAGCRAWGHGHGLGFGFHSIWRCALGEETRKGDSWESLVLRRCLPDLKDIAANLYYNSPDEIVELLPQYGMREDFELYLYQDGSRVCIMGTDEPGFDDEDDNGNTLGFLAFVVDQGRGRVDSYPEWPAPNTGETRIRQRGAQADIDRHPSGKGWLLRHSLVGRRYVDGYWETDIPEPAAPLVAAYFAPQGQAGGWVRLDAPAVPVEPQPTPAPVKPTEKPSWIERMGL